MAYILEKKNLSNFLTALAPEYQVFAPVKRGEYTQFEALTANEELALDDAHNTRVPPKALFLPMSETLMSYRPNGRAEMAALAEEKRVVFGMRPCDAQAVALLDTVFEAEDYNDPYWRQRRDNILVFGLGCNQPCASCFCNSVESGPFSTLGQEVTLTDLGDAYYLQLNDTKAEGLLEGLPKASPQQESEAQAIQKQAAESMPGPFKTAEVKAELDSNFNSAFWSEISAACLGCGICTFLCPTCFCFDIVDEVQRSDRVRNWDTCMFRVYSHETSGHNPRPTKRERTRQRVMHKFSYWLDHADQIGCTGCGRCVRYCPVGIDIRAIVRKAAELPLEVAHAG